MSWTTPEDIRTQLRRRWDRGELLAPPAGEPLFPLRPRFSRPDARELADRFDDVRAWIRGLEAESKARRGFGYEIQWAEVQHRQLGANRVPVGIVVPEVEDAAWLIGEADRVEIWHGLVAATGRTCPSLMGWVMGHPLEALARAKEWGQLMAVVDWFVKNPRPGVYLRQVEVPAVDTKFIFARRALIGDLLDHVLPAGAVRREVSATRLFERRYGLREKPALVRFRVLDDRLSVGGLTDIATPAAEFARLELPAQRVFVTENEINGLAFPAVRGGTVIFGLGYGLARISEATWLRDREVYYWGDIDTHGFAMLDRLRAGLPGAQSLLMDRETLLEHRPWWDSEETQCTEALERLNEPERRLYEDLRQDQLGHRVRLEQERISMSWLERALRAIGA